MLKKLTTKQTGFTIVELLIVIVVIGILAALVLNTFQGVQARARDTERRTDINAISTQLEVYYADNGHYPSGVTANTDCVDPNGAAIACTLGSAILPGIDAEALNDPNNNALNVGSDPDSPAAGTENQYHYNATGCGTGSGQCTTFELGTTLEDDSSVYKKNSLN